MESTGRPAEPIAVGVWATAKQSFSDLFKWEQRVKITNEYGESRTEWQRPLPLRNPISLLAQLTPTAWVFFIVGFASWTVRVCVCVCVRERGREETNPEHSPISSKRKTTKKKPLESPPPYSKKRYSPANQFSISSPPSRPTPSTSTPSASKLPNWPIITIPPIPTSPVPLLSRCCYVLSERQFLGYSEISLGGNGRWYVMSLTILFLPD